MAVVARLIRDAGGVLVSWALLVVLEFVVIGESCKGLFAGNWELIQGRRLVGPIALAMLAPGVLLVVGGGRLVASAATSQGARRLLGAVGGILAGSVGLGVTEGRHFESLAVRVPFVAGAALVGFALAYGSPRLWRVADDRGARLLPLALGAFGTASAWWVDAHVLPRLYPAFHTLMLGATLVFAALPVLAWRSREAARVPAGELVVGVVGLVSTIAACAWAPTAAHGLARSDNLRFVLEEHAPLLGRAVRVATWLAPPVPLDVADTPTSVPPTEVPRALDWSNQDILLISIDALRADHLSAYGYPRGATPNLDALARESALFEHAYCPTPHTSYSVTSMMTGKAMRPLLSLGLGADSDTWATYLRRYGYKTAAFYPPAIFYIDAPRFTRFQETGLGFEYRWVEFTTADEKVLEVSKYLDTAGPTPLFMWVHFFEPHEPYVAHPSHPFAGGESPAVDAYDSEVAYTDAAIGDLLRVVRAKRPRVTVVVTADHGEEFGDHGGRYHGTTCYEEQVRVPLLVSGPGVEPRKISTVVQTIDLLPTVLSALGIPRPARVRGRDLGRVLAHTNGGKGGPDDDRGLAYAETDEQTLVARGDDRLLCARKIAACALYDVAKDPTERADRTAREPGIARELRGLLGSIEREQGRYEAAEVIWPDPLRRGLQGETDAAVDVAALLDDANVVIRRKAAEVSFDLAVPEVIPELERALARDEDAEVKRWSAVALVRMGAPPGSLAEALVHDDARQWRRAAALAFALHGDPRGKAELATWWREEGPPHPGLDVTGAKELLTALARIHDVDAVPALVASLDYVPLRARIAATLGDIGDSRGRAPLLALFAKERYETARPAEARAVLMLGGAKELAAPLALFAGLVDPMTEAVAIALDGRLLDMRAGGLAVESSAADVELRVKVPSGVPLRLWVLAEGEGGALSGEIAGEPIVSVTTTGAVHAVDLGARGGVGDQDLTLHVQEPKRVKAVWVVPRLAALPSFLVAREPDAGAAAITP